MSSSIDRSFLKIVTGLSRATKHAQDNGWELGKHAEKIVAMVVKNDGLCPCKKGNADEVCPCPDHRQEIEENGHCTCNLFVKGIEI